MRRFLLVTLALMLATALPAVAAEFVPAWESRLVWDSNVLSAPKDPLPGQPGAEDDFSLRSGPDLRFRERQGDLTYDVNYRLRFEEFARLNGLDQLNSKADFDHTLSLRGQWRATPRTQISVNDEFLFVTGYSGLFDTPAAADPTLAAVVVPTRERFTINTASATVTHSLGPLWQLSAQINNQLYRYRDPNQSDSDGTAGSVQLTRGISRRAVAGFGATVNRQEFSEVGEIPGRGTTFYQTFGVLEYQISPTWSFSARAGPAWTQPDQPDAVSEVEQVSYRTVIPSTCPTRNGVPIFTPTLVFGGCEPSRLRFRFNGQLVNPGLPSDVTDVPPSDTLITVPFTGESEAEGSLTYFGRIEINKSWRLWRASLSYDRSASNGSGFGTSTTLDLLSGSLTWTPTPLWNVSLTANYSTQSAASEVAGVVISLAPALVENAIFRAVVGVPIDVGTEGTITNAIDITTYRVDLRARRKMSHRLTLVGDLGFYRQENDSAFQSTKRDDYRVELGFIWNFDPIPL